jgi:hypothetical protein
MPTERWQPDRSTPPNPWATPNLTTAIGRGLRGRCPACGEGKIFDGFLKVAAHCNACDAPLGLARADDAPPYFTILIVAATASLDHVGDLRPSDVGFDAQPDPPDQGGHGRTDAEPEHAEVRSHCHMTRTAI